MYPIRVLVLIPTIAFGLLTGCSSNPKSEVAADPVTQAEIARLEVQMSDAHQNNVDVASPRAYKEAQENFEDAKDLQKKQADRSKVMDKVNKAQGALNEATSKAGRTQESLTDVLSARKAALVANAEGHYKIEMAQADKNLVDETWNYEKGKGSISQKKREAIRKSYETLELRSLQKTHLGEARRLIENAEKNDAKKFAPRSLETAKAKLKGAEQKISSNRTDKTAIEAAAVEATAEARKLVQINQNARRAKGLSAEEIALGTYAKDQELASASQQIERRDEALTESAQEREAALAASAQDKEAALAAKDSELSERDRELAARNSALVAVNSEKSALERQAEFNKALADAQKEFSKDQAEVYRQGDNLLIRLKSATFATGSADLAGPALPVLNKVKDLVAKIDAEKVVVEGHTDSTGTAAGNQKLSELRAETVAQFITSSNVVNSSQVETQGMSFDRPLASNKTKEGRAQNRRVDIIITPKALK